LGPSPIQAVAKFLILIWYVEAIAEEDEALHISTQNFDQCEEKGNN
jgi:hypothetical protein